MEAAYGLVISMVGILVIAMAYEQYRFSDRGYWHMNSTPDYNAQLVKADQQKVYQGRKHYARLKTILYFSDGFYFVTYKTKINVTENYGLVQHYNMSVDADRIVALADKAHKKAVRKKLRKSC